MKRNRSKKGIICVLFRIVYVVIFSGMIFCNPIFPNETSLPVKVFSTDEKGQILQVKPEQSFLLVLPDPSAGGYMAQKIPEFDPEILVLKKMEQKPPRESNRRGNFGSIEWHFRARKEGISALTIRASRPWENDQAPIILFEAMVQVTQ
mgnify:CR=1 FL=1